MKNAVNKQPSGTPPQNVRPVRFSDPQSVEEMAHLLHAPALALLTRLSGDEHPSPHQYSALFFATAD